MVEDLSGFMLLATTPSLQKTLSLCGDMDKMHYLVEIMVPLLILGNPNNFVNLKGNEAPYTPDLALTARFEHTYKLQKWYGTQAWNVNYHWEAESYVTPWNMDKHVNDEGGCDWPWLLLLLSL